MAKAKHMSDETAHLIDEEVRLIVTRNFMNELGQL